eukprot:m.93804 g.93804  ORF g.93804 m.93804 type:complete len:148 (+) comp12399_c0_seq4:107-550(+)
MLETKRVCWIQFNMPCPFPQLVTLCNSSQIVPARGETKFGWDPIFNPDDFEETYAEMDSEVKNGISHRGRALQKVIEYFAANETEIQQFNTSVERWMQCSKTFPFFFGPIIQLLQCLIKSKSTIFNILSQSLLELSQPFRQLLLLNP